MISSNYGFFLLGYLLGSFPTAYLAARRAGKNIFELGDGNMGSKNTFLNLGMRAGVLVGLADITKGALAVWLARWLGASETGVYWAGFAAVLGHDFPLYLRFRGGQGMAAALGVLGTLQPIEVLVGAVLALVLLHFTQNWDVSWAIGLALVPVAGMAFNRPLKEVLYVVILLPTIGLKKLFDMLISPMVYSRN